MQKLFKIPAAQDEWTVLYCRVMALFALQGLIILAIYGVRGFGVSPDDLPPGLRLDPMHGVIHLVTGLAGAYFGFFAPAGSLRFLKGFTVFYLLLAIFGTFTETHFGMQLELEENALHWPLSLAAGVIAFAPSILVRKARPA